MPAHPASDEGYAKAPQAAYVGRGLLISRWGEGPNPHRQHGAGGRVQRNSQSDGIAANRSLGNTPGGFEQAAQPKLREDSMRSEGMNETLQ